MRLAGGRASTFCLLPFLSTLGPVPKLTVTVITRNESANLDAALASVAWADEILIVD